MTNTSWSKLQKKYKLSKNKIYSALKGKKNTQRISIPAKEKANCNTEIYYYFSYWFWNWLKHNKHVVICFILGKPYNMALLMLLGYLMCNVLLAWATLQQPYISKSLSSPPPWNPNRWVHLVIFKPQPKIN